jgi:Secretion system C-terminal sorting domain/WD40-like Beta Propeller Repeat
MNFYLLKQMKKKRSLLIFGILLLTPISILSQNESHQIFNKQLLEGERIFFIRKHNVSGVRVGDIYSMSSSGGDVQQVTNFSKDLFITEFPSISHDGKKLTFISNYEEWKSSNYADAFIADLNTGVFKRVTGYEKTSPTNATGTVNVTVHDPKNYALTPSAIRISYSGCSSFVTGNTATITVPANEEIWIKAVVARGKGDVKVINIGEGGNTSAELDLSAGTITSESCSPSFNGDYLAVSRNSETMDFPWSKILIWDTQKHLPIAEVGGLKLGGDIFPAYSPDDSKLAFGTGEPLINSLGVVSTQNISVKPEIIANGNIIGFQAFCSQPTWSPSGNEVAFVYTILSGLEIQSNIYKVILSSGNISQITFLSGSEIASRPSFSPTGSQIAFTYLKSNSSIFSLTDLINGNFFSNIYSIPSGSGLATALTTDGNSLDPCWSYINSVVNVEEKKLVNEFKLSQNYPNPFNPKTRIEYKIPVASIVILKVYDVLGKEITILVKKWHQAGKYSVDLNASSLSSGMYICTIEANEFFDSKKQIVLK